MTSLLERYRLKRDFKRTKEPSGIIEKTSLKAKMPGGIFVVHKHDARRLHYDLRLEHGGVLWSWAVTRGPSLNPADKRLAVHVEDHPLDYGSFEGTIPEGSYGAGTVIVWDEGTWVPEGDAAAGMKKGHLQFTLAGDKLKGAWHLVRIKPREGEKRDNWLLIKSDDEHAKTKGDILETAPKSVKSGLTNTDIESGKNPRPLPKAKPKKSVASPMPDFISPALATLKTVPPVGESWLHEVKFDGYRLQAHIAKGKLKLFTRSGLDWAERFGKELRSALLALDCRQAVIDGEVVVLSDKGIASFALLQAALSEGLTDRMVFYAFDLLHLDGRSLLSAPLTERKAELERLLGELKPDSKLRFSEHFAQTGEVMLAHACRMGLEGVISKRGDAPYRSGRSFDWIKSKCTLRQEFVILGYLPSQATGRGLRSIIVGYQQNGKLVHGGRVGTGFTVRSGDDLKRRLDRLKTGSPAVAGLERQERGAIWVKPELVAEVEFRTWTADGRSRQASFQGLREDKEPASVVKEEPVVEEAPKSRKRRAAAVTPVTTAVTLSNPAKLLWPKAGITKQGLLDHYAAVWPRIERFIVNRPLSLVRAPDGVGGQRFFQKHASAGMHQAISTLKDPEDGQQHLFIRDFDGLAALAQLGVVEIHIWGATADAIDTPDQVVFDLDPDEGLSPDAVREATLDIRAHLAELGFTPFVKTSGGKGFHVVVPLKPKARWPEVKGFAHDFAAAMAQAEPDRYTAQMSKKSRKGRIFIDYLRNGRGSTTVAPYSLRAREEASISMPVTWKSVEAGISPQAFAAASAATVKQLAAPDPWQDFFASARPLVK